jgi:hypothetical protein
MTASSTGGRSWCRQTPREPDSEPPRGGAGFYLLLTSEMFSRAFCSAARP